MWLLLLTIDLWVAHILAIFKRPFCNKSLLYTGPYEWTGIQGSTFEGESYKLEVIRRVSMYGTCV
jgi:hypothetical protein